MLAARHDVLLLASEDASFDKRGPVHFGEYHQYTLLQITDAVRRFTAVVGDCRILQWRPGWKPGAQSRQPKIEPSRLTPVAANHAGMHTSYK